MAGNDVYEDVYTFGAIGNRTAVSADGGTTTAPYVPDNLNQYDTVGGTTFTMTSMATCPTTEHGTTNGTPKTGW